MTLRDLVLKMYADEKLVLTGFDKGEVMETTPNEIINEYEILWCFDVVHIWFSRNLYNAIVIEIE